MSDHKECAAEVREVIVERDDWKARAEKAEAALTRAERENVALANASTTTAEALATARAVMAEEARRAAKHSIESHRDRYGFPHEIQQHIENHIRALATLPAGLVVLKAEVVAKARRLCTEVAVRIAFIGHPGEKLVDQGLFVHKDTGLPVQVGDWSNICRLREELVAALDAAGGCG